MSNPPSLGTTVDEILAGFEAAALAYSHRCVEIQIVGGERIALYFPHETKPGLPLRYAKIVDWVAIKELSAAEVRELRHDIAMGRAQIVVRDLGWFTMRVREVLHQATGQPLPGYRLTTLAGQPIEVPVR